MYRNRGQARNNARKAITREAHGVVLELHREHVPKENADWHYDMRRFMDECFHYTPPREPVTSSTLTRYRTAQDEGVLCAHCGMVYTIGCNSGACC